MGYDITKTNIMWAGYISICLYGVRKIWADLFSEDLQRLILLRRSVCSVEENQFLRSSTEH